MPYLDIKSDISIGNVQFFKLKFDTSSNKLIIFSQPNLPYLDHNHWNKHSLQAVVQEKVRIEFLPLWTSAVL